jgi:hypothetical protein
VKTIFPAFDFGDAAVRIFTIVFGIGLLPALVFARAYEQTTEGRGPIAGNLLRPLVEPGEHFLVPENAVSR